MVTADQLVALQKLAAQRAMQVCDKNYWVTAFAVGYCWWSSILWAENGFFQIAYTCMCTLYTMMLCLHLLQCKLTYVLFVLLLGFVVFNRYGIDQIHNLRVYRIFIIVRVIQRWQPKITSPNPKTMNELVFKKNVIDWSIRLINQLVWLIDWIDQLNKQLIDSIGDGSMNWLCYPITTGRQWSRRSVRYGERWRGAFTRSSDEIHGYEKTHYRSGWQRTWTATRCTS